MIGFDRVVGVLLQNPCQRYVTDIEKRGHVVQLPFRLHCEIERGRSCLRLAREHIEF